MSEEVILSYEKKIEKRNEVKAKIEEVQKELEKVKDKIKNMKNELNIGKGENGEREVEKTKSEECVLEKKIRDLNEELIKIPIPVPEEGDFEILNGIIGIKRDLNLKLVRGFDDDTTVQVFFLFYFILFLIFF
jgi:protein subunit release factor A